MKHGGDIFWEIYEVRKGFWAYFFCLFTRMLIGWAGKLRSRGPEQMLSGLMWKWKWKWEQGMFVLVAVAVFAILFSWNC